MRRHHTAPVDASTTRWGATRRSRRPARSGPSGGAGRRRPGSPHGGGRLQLPCVRRSASPCRNSPRVQGADHAARIRLGPGTWKGAARTFDAEVRAGVVLTGGRAGSVACVALRYEEQEHAAGDDADRDAQKGAHEKSRVMAFTSSPCSHQAQPRPHSTVHHRPAMRHRPSPSPTTRRSSTPPRGEGQNGTHRLNAEPTPKVRWPRRQGCDD